MSNENQDIVKAILELDKSLGCISFDTNTTKLIDNRLVQITTALNRIADSLDQLTKECGK